MKILNFSTQSIKSNLLLLILTLLLNAHSIAQNNCKEVIGYYPNWQWYDRNKLVSPESINYSKYTIINYSFVYPLSDGTITLTDPWADKNLLLGTINWGVAPAGYDSSYDLGNPAYHNSNTSIVYHAHQNNVPVMMSIGGWTLSDDFPSIAATPAYRTNFAHWCNELVRVYDIDGVDIDWEYPGFVAHGGTVNDITNYTLLLQEIRDSLDVMEVQSGKSLMLTAAFSGDPNKMDDIEWDAVVPLLDYINLMSYDFFGAFDAETNHNSPLYSPASGNPDFNCNNAIQRLINDYNVPSEKINLGVAFYGRSTKTNGAPTLHGPSQSAADLVTFAADEGTPLYYNIVNQMSAFDYNWDDIAKVPYLTGNNGLNTFLSYDDEQSIGLKGQYIVDHNLAGAIIWEITGDYIETSPGSGVIASTPLVDTLNLALCHPPTPDSGNGGSGNGTGNEGVGIDNLVNDEFRIFPNPTSGIVYLDYGSKSNITQIKVLTSNGRIVYQTNQPQTKLDLSELETGIYFIQLESTSDNSIYKIIKQ